MARRPFESVDFQFDEERWEAAMSSTCRSTTRDTVLNAKISKPRVRLLCYRDKFNFKRKSRMTSLRLSATGTSFQAINRQHLLLNDLGRRALRQGCGEYVKLCCAAQTL